MLLVLLVGVVAADAQAQRVSILPFTGPNGVAVRNQLVTAVCDTAECVTPTKVTTGVKPDWKKAKKEAVAFIVQGTVGKKTLDLVVSNATGVKTKKTYPLQADGLAAKTLASALEQLKSSFDAGGAAADPGPATPPVEPKKTPPPPEPVARTSPGTGAGTAPHHVADPDGAGAEQQPEEAPEPAVGGPRRHHGLTLGLGVDLLNRQLSYVQQATNNLRAYQLSPVFPLPVISLEFSPLASSRQGLLAGLGLEASFAINPALKSHRATSTVSYPTSTMRLDAAVRWRLMPLAGYALALTPAIGVRVQSFKVGAASDGTTLDGLPGINDVGLRAGLGVELPLVTDRLTFVGHFSVLPVFSGGELLSAAYFAHGSAMGLEGNAGFEVRLTGGLSARATFEFTQVSYTFKTETTDTYQATGAVDRYLGGNVSLRYGF
jgi:hypothetical protein